MASPYDAVIVGAGPAGASCALWMARLGLRPLIVDRRDRVGGLLNDTPYVNDWLVTQPGMTGFSMAGNLAASLSSAGVPVLTHHFAKGVRRHRGRFEVALAAGDDDVKMVSGRFLVIASGVQAVRGDFQPGPSILIGPGAHVAGYKFLGKRVAILGGGDNAFENYRHTQDAGASKIDIFARSVRASHAAVAAVAKGDVHIGPYEADGNSRTVNGRSYDVLMVMYGWEPCPALSGLKLSRDAKGFILVDMATCETDLVGVYAIGEVTRRSHPCVATAMAEGVIVAKAIQRIVEGS